MKNGENKKIRVGSKSHAMENQPIVRKMKKGIFYCLY